MPKLNIKFKRKLIANYSLRVVVDDADSFSIGNGLSKKIDICEGDHHIEAFIPFDGNDTYIANMDINIKSDICYEMEYYLSFFSNSGNIKIKENIHNYESDGKNNKKTGKKIIYSDRKNKNYINILIAALTMLVMLSVTVSFIVEGIDEYLFQTKVQAAAVIEEKMETEMDAGKHIKETPRENVVAQGINTPCTMYGIKVTATDIVTVVDKESPNNELSVQVRFVIENISKKNFIFLNSRLSAYIDGKTVTSYMTGKDIVEGKITQGNRTQGYYGVSIAKDVKQIEIVLSADEYNKENITFVLEIPPVSE